MINKQRAAGDIGKKVSSDPLSSTSPAPTIPTEPHTRTSSGSGASRNQLISAEKAKAFEIFKSGYPAGGWIDGQKKLLKAKYAEAKKLGEKANNLRNEISLFKLLTSRTSEAKIIRRRGIA